MGAGLLPSLAFFGFASEAPFVAGALFLLLPALTPVVAIMNVEADCVVVDSDNRGMCKGNAMGSHAAEQGLATVAKSTWNSEIFI